MKNEDIRCMISKLFNETAENIIHLPEENCDVPILEEPLVGFAAADDPLFEVYKNDPEAIGEAFMTPEEWLPGAKSVIVMFFPYSEDIRGRLARSETVIHESWKYGYVPGSRLAKAIAAQLKDLLAEQGITAIEPTSTERFSRVKVPVSMDEEEDVHYMVSWSTRHAGFAAGLGTFGIHRHFITEKGSCGSLATLITDHEFTPTERDYTDIYEYCIHCGQCARNCPAKAIDPNGLRNLKKCSDYGAYLRENCGGGGCGRCFVGVPCEHRNPSRR